ncbi:MAG: 2-dehydropantoate 2-reductase N-terminal domain-containing protein [Polyangiaceae bacterium]
MHVAVVGAGALGRIYGLRLATAGRDHGVSFVVRRTRLAERGPFVLEEASGWQRRDVLEPQRVAEPPADADAVLLTVRCEQVDAALAEALAAVPARAPIVTLTPLFPREHAALERALARPVVSAMPGVNGYADARGFVRYWVLPQPTLVDDPGQGSHARPALAELCEALEGAGLPARLRPGVAALDAGSTTVLYPYIAAVGVAGSVRALAADLELGRLTARAGTECRELARRVGEVAPWAEALHRAFAPRWLRPAVAVAGALFPEQLRFVDTHFGPKLLAQHLSMGESVLALAAEHDVAAPALSELVARLRPQRAAPRRA